MKGGEKKLAHLKQDERVDELINIISTSPTTSSW